MNDNTLELFWWGLALVVLVPVAVVGLGEAALRLRQTNSRYLRFVELLRTVLLPSTIAVVVVRAVLTVGTDRLATRIAMTALLISIGYVGLGLIRNLSAEKRPERWENRIPGLFKIMLRLAFVIVPIFLLFDTWGIDLTSNLGALGIGGVAIAFALQDAIGNVVSGVLLIVDRPFSVGDWIEVDGMHGEVVDISWRSTRIRVDRDVMILPNIGLSNSSIRNLTALDPVHELFVDFSFGPDDRPAVVKEMLVEIATDNDEISKANAPSVHLLEYGDSSTTYRLHYSIDRYQSDFHAAEIKDQLRTTVFHAHARYGLSMPFPTFVHINQDVPVDDADDSDIADFLRWNPVFSTLPDPVLTRLADTARLRTYASEETILDPDRQNDQLHILRSGKVEIVGDTSHANRLMLQTGDVFGEEAIVSQVAGSWTAAARTDVEVIAFDASVILTVSEQHQRFATTLNRLITDRHRMRTEATQPLDLVVRPTNGMSPAGQPQHG